MKVCLLNDSFPPAIDGVVNVVMNYARIMQEENLADVVVGTPKYPGTNYQDYPYRVIPYQSFNTARFANGYRAGNPMDIKEVMSLIEYEPDIIHTHCPMASTVLGRMVRSRTQAPLVFTYHTKFDVDIAKAIKAEYIQEQSIKFLVNNIEACDEVWVVSHGAGENLKSLGYQGDYTVVNNGVDFAKGRVDADYVREVTKDYDLPEGLPVFLFVGRMVTYKGLPLILDALKIVADTGMDFRMVFIGGGVDENAMKEKAKNLGLYECGENGADKCIFTGPIHDRTVLRAWNTRADIFLFPSTYDTNGIVVREAAACGLASVLIAGSCAAEGITDDRNGFIIEETPEAMAALLCKISRDLDHVHDVGQHAMDEIYISWEESVHQAHERYQVILDKKAQGLYQDRQPLTEQFKYKAEEFLFDMQSLARVPKKIFDNMLDNVEDLGQSFVLEIKDGMVRATKSFTDDMRQIKRSIIDERLVGGISKKEDTVAEKPEGLETTENAEVIDGTKNK